jgi:hypothetical protein
MPMNPNNSNKKHALEQIDAIYKTVQENFNVSIYGPEIAINGLIIAAIPLIEYFLSISIDPIIAKFTIHETIALFAIRTAFYWSLFYGISKIFEAQEKDMKGNQLIRKKIEAYSFFPLIPITTAIALLIAGQTSIIAPIICIIIGSQLLQLSKFTSPVIKTTALVQIFIGITSIILTQYPITHLWAYSIGLFGFSFVITGLILTQNQKNR